MLTIRAMSNGEGYAARHLAHSDYYAEGERVVGRWFGRGAQLLGLSGEVQSEHFEAVREGLHPFSGEFLRQRRSADRIAADGSTRSHGRNLYDFTFSAPKSVSIIAELTGDQRLVEAHQNAVTAALHELESYAATGVRRAGASHDRTTAISLSPSITTTPAASSIPNSTPMPSPPISPGTAPKTAGRRSRLTPSTSVAPTSPRFIAIT